MDGHFQQQMTIPLLPNVFFSRVFHFCLLIPAKAYYDFILSLAISFIQNFLVTPLLDQTNSSSFKKMATTCQGIPPALLWTEDHQFSILFILRAGAAADRIMSKIQTKQQQVNPSQYGNTVTYRKLCLDTTLMADWANSKKNPLRITKDSRNCI